jgi:hypothetical protein
LTGLKNILEAIAERMIAAEEKNLTPRDLDVAGGIVDYMATLPPHMQKDIRRLIVLFEYLPLLVIFRARKFTRLTSDDQDRYIEAWGTSRVGLLRTGFRVLKSLCVSTYYQNPASWDAIGYKE